MQVLQISTLTQCWYTGDVTGDVMRCCNWSLWYPTIIYAIFPPELSYIFISQDDLKSLMAGSNDILCIMYLIFSFTQRTEYVLIDLYIDETFWQ